MIEEIKTASYQLTWYVPDKVLLLSIYGNYPVEDASEANQHNTEVLTQSQSPLFLLIDARQMNRPYNFDRIRSTQTYMHHPQLRRIYVAASDQVIRLAMVVIFNLSRASLHLYNDLEKATIMVRKQLSTM